MNLLLLPRDLLEQIEAEARHAYPEEACGFLFASTEDADSETRKITAVQAAPNSFEGERRRRFVIRPDELKAAEARASERHGVVAGFYHSHPDHAAEPSEFDTDHAWPWYAYLIVSVDAGGDCSAGVFELDGGDARFRKRSLDVVRSERAAPQPADAAYVR